MHNQPYVGRIAHLYKENLLKSGEIRDFYGIVAKVQPNQIWQDQDDAHSLIILDRSMVSPYLIGSYFSICLSVPVSL